MVLLIATDAIRSKSIGKNLASSLNILLCGLVRETKEFHHVIPILRR